MGTDIDAMIIHRTTRRKRGDWVIIPDENSDNQEYTRSE